MARQPNCHTPGPWRIVRAVDFTGDTESQYNPILSIDAANGKTVYFTDSGYFKPHEADARLIAAAPELLAALEMAMKANDWHIEPPLDTYGAKAYAAARAAISRATGES